MKPLVKAGLVIAGYLMAVLIASAVVTVYVARTLGPDRQASSGMYAFGDSLLFLAVFGVAAVLPTGAGLFFLRECGSFWRALAVAAPAVVATGLAACVLYVVGRSSGPGSMLGQWAAFAVLRILMAPLVVLALFLSALFAPTRPYRVGLLVAAGVEAILFGCIALTWLYGMRPD